jgi:hypothetical protein
MRHTIWAAGLLGLVLVPGCATFSGPPYVIGRQSYQSVVPDLYRNPARHGFSKYHNEYPTPDPQLPRAPLPPLFVAPEPIPVTLPAGAVPGPGPVVPVPVVPELVSPAAPAEIGPEVLPAPAGSPGWQPTKSAALPIVPAF